LNMSAPDFAPLTVISFQKVVPGARERLVQITGPVQDNILQARRLIEDSIRRNQSPVRKEEEEVDSRRTSGHCGQEGGQGQTSVGLLLPAAPTMVI